MTRPDSIRAIGLKKYLNQTADKHNNYTYSDFIKFVSGPATPTKTALARLFNVDRMTMSKWLSIHELEKTDKVK